MQEEQFDGFEEDPLPSDGEPDFDSDLEADEPHAADLSAEDFSDEPISGPDEPASAAGAAGDDGVGQHEDAAADVALGCQQGHEQAASPEPQVGCSLDLLIMLCQSSFRLCMPMHLFFCVTLSNPVLHYAGAAA